MMKEFKGWCIEWNEYIMADIVFWGDLAAHEERSENEMFEHHQFSPQNNLSTLALLPTGQDVKFIPARFHHLHEKRAKLCVRLSQLLGQSLYLLPRALLYCKQSIGEG